MAEHPLYLFAHIPKTAGQTLRRHFRRHIRPRERVIAVNARDENAPGSTGAPAGPDRASCDLVVGHRVTLEITREFPNRAHRFFTVLRDPVEHTISSYNWEAHQLYSSQGKKPPRFERWFRKRKCSLMAWWLISRFKKVPAEIHMLYSQERLLEEAGQLLDQFWLVACVEELETSLGPVFEALGIPTQLKVRRNVAGRDYPILITRTPETENLIREQATADVALYARFCGPANPARG